MESLQNGQSVVIDARTLNLRRPLSITRRNVTLRGAKETTLECPESSPALFLYGRDVHLANMRFSGCQGQPAVAIEGNDRRTVRVFMEHVAFDHNNGTAVEWSASFDRASSPLIIRRCREAPCEASVSVEISEAVFSNNHGDQGGAIFCQDASLTVCHSTFLQNTAQRSGGAILATGPMASVIVDSCQFEENRVTGRGQERPVNAAMTGQLLEVVSYWTFAFPTATGGAIDIFTIAHLSIHNTNFSSNTAFAGGAVAITVDVDSVHAENRSREFDATISNCIFAQDQAHDAEGVLDVMASEVHMGGAIYVVSNAVEFDLLIEDSNFHHNRAQFGGALHLVASTTTFPQIHRSHFSQNSATDWGGAILLRNAGHLELRESNCTDNFASLGGCMMLTNNAGLQVKGPSGLPPNRQGISSYFKRNSAIYGGAVMCTACHDVVLRDPYFIGNTALRSGGAIHVWESDHPFSIEQSTFQGNQALLGGAVSIQAAEEVQIRGSFGLKSHFIDNRAVGGGAIHASATSQRENRFHVSLSFSQITF